MSILRWYYDFLLDRAEKKATQGNVEDGARRCLKLFGKKCDAPGRLQRIYDNANGKNKDTVRDLATMYAGDAEDAGDKTQAIDFVLSTLRGLDTRQRLTAVNGTIRLFASPEFIRVKQDLLQALTADGNYYDLVIVELDSTTGIGGWETIARSAFLGKASQAASATQRESVWRDYFAFFANRRQRPGLSRDSGFDLIGDQPSSQQAKTLLGKLPPDKLSATDSASLLVAAIGAGKPGLKFVRLLLKSAQERLKLASRKCDYLLNLVCSLCPLMKDKDAKWLQPTYDELLGTLEGSLLAQSEQSDNETAWEVLLNSRDRLTRAGVWENVPPTIGAAIHRVGFEQAKQFEKATGYKEAIDWYDKSAPFATSDEVVLHHLRSRICRLKQPRCRLDEAAKAELENLLKAPVPADAETKSYRADLLYRYAYYLLTTPYDVYPENLAVVRDNWEGLLPTDDPMLAAIEERRVKEANKLTTLVNRRLAALNTDWSTRKAKSLVQTLAENRGKLSWKYARMGYKNGSFLSAYLPFAEGYLADCFANQKYYDAFLWWKCLAGEPDNKEFLRHPYRLRLLECLAAYQTLMSGQADKKDPNLPLLIGCALLLPHWNQPFVNSLAKTTWDDGISFTFDGAIGYDEWQPRSPQEMANLKLENLGWNIPSSTVKAFADSQKFLLDELFKAIQTGYGDDWRKFAESQNVYFETLIRLQRGVPVTTKERMEEPSGILASRPLYPACLCPAMTYPCDASRETDAKGKLCNLLKSVTSGGDNERVNEVGLFYGFGSVAPFSEYKAQTAKVIEACRQLAPGGGKGNPLFDLPGASPLPYSQRSPGLVKIVDTAIGQEETSGTLTAQDFLNKFSELCSLFNEQPLRLKFLSVLNGKTIQAVNADKMTLDAGVRILVRGCAAVNEYGHQQVNNNLEKMVENLVMEGNHQAVVDEYLQGLPSDRKAAAREKIAQAMVNGQLNKIVDDVNNNRVSHANGLQRIVNLYTANSEHDRLAQNLATLLTMNLQEYPQSDTSTRRAIDSSLAELIAFVRGAQPSTYLLHCQPEIAMQHAQIQAALSFDLRMALLNPSQLTPQGLALKKSLGYFQTLSQLM